MKAIINKSTSFLIAAALMAISIFSVTYYQHKIEQQIQQNANQVLQDSAAEQAQIFNAILDGQYQSLSLAAQALDLSGQPISASAWATLKRLTEKTEFTCLMLAGTDGVAYTSAGDKLDLSAYPYFQTCMAGNRVIEKTRAPEEGDGGQFIIGIPILQDGRVIAALLGEYPNKGFVKMLISTAYGDTAYSFVCDDQGNVVIASNHPSYLNQVGNLLTYLQNQGDLSSEQASILQHRLAGGNPGFIHYTAEGQTRYAAYQSLVVNSWTIFNAVPGHVIELQANQTAKMGTLVILIITLVSLLLLLLLTYLKRRDKRRMEADCRKMQADKERLRIALSNTTLTIWDFDLAARQIIQTKESLRQHGLAKVIDAVPEGLVQSGYVHPDDIAAFCEMYRSIYAGAAYAQGVFRVRTADCSGWWYEHVQYTTLFDKHGKPYLAIGASLDVTNQYELQKAVDQDSLTGLLNHNATIRNIEQQLSQADASRVQALFVIDLDYFKQINDTSGHQAGDQILIEAADLLKQAFRRGDIVGRVGGDEFLAFLSNAPSPQIVEEKAAQLVRTLHITKTVGEHVLHLTGSVGVAFYRQGESFNELYKRADGLLYQTKKQGRNNYLLEHPDARPV